jgi:Fe-S oxidoreductase
MDDELGSSRAKANLLNYWATGQLSDEEFESPEFRKFLDLCVNCKMCQQQCPSGVDVSTLMVAARTEYARRKRLRPTETVLSNNRLLSVLGSAFSPLSSFAMRLPVSRWMLEKVAGIDRRRSMPRFGRGGFLKAGRKYLAACGPITEPVDKVAYFVDTYANYNDHELGFAVIDVLRHNNVEVVLPAQRPAPLPAIVYGDVRRARRELSHSVRHLAAAVRSGHKVVCSEPSAALCLRQEMRHYVAGEEASLVSANTHELMSYLSSLRQQGHLKRGNGTVGETFAYHLPCHLSAIGGETVSVDLLRGHFHMDVTDLQAGCCGLSGTFGMQKKNYELSDRISESLRAAIDASAGHGVLTECAACKMQIEHVANRPVIHPVKLVARAYGL